MKITKSFSLLTIAYILIAAVPVMTLALMIFKYTLKYAPARINVVDMPTGSCKIGVNSFTDTTPVGCTSGYCASFKYTCYDKSNGEIKNINTKFRASGIFSSIAQYICTKISLSVCEPTPVPGLTSMPAPTSARTTPVPTSTPAPAKSCQELCVGLKYQYGACGTLTDPNKNYWCGPENDPARANLCYYAVKSIGNAQSINYSNSTCPINQQCLCYNRTACGTDAISCKLRCTSSGCSSVLNPTPTLAYRGLTPTPTQVYWLTPTPPPNP